MKVLSIPTRDIIVDENRFRPVVLKDPEVKRLIESIKTLGLLNPITVNLDEDGKYHLVAGGHRLGIFKFLGIPEIPSHLQSELTELTRREMELAENIERKQMSAAEQIQAVAEIHRLRTAQNPKWTQEQTAALVKSTRRTDVTEALKLDKMIKLFPELGAAKSVNQLRSLAEHKAALVVRHSEVKAQTKTRPAVSAIAQRVWLGDSVERIKEIEDESFNLILTDPPFGVNYDDKASGTVGALTDYEDDAASYQRLLTMAPDLFRVLKPNGFLVWFFGISNYDLVKQTFKEVGFFVDEIPIIWDRSEGKCFTRRPDRYLARGYDVAIQCIKGNPQIVKRNVPNVLHHKPVGATEREALVERPIELYKELIEIFTLRGESVADFFAGSGSVLAAAALTGREYFGCELSEERHALAISKVLANTPS